MPRGTDERQPRWIDESPAWYGPIADGDFVCLTIPSGVHFVKLSALYEGDRGPRWWPTHRVTACDIFNCPIAGVVDCDACLAARIERLYSVDLGQEPNQ